MVDGDVDEEHRRLYRREGEGYPRNLRDAEWARLAPLIPEASPGGRPRKTDMRAAMNAFLYLLRTGCPWRYATAFRPARPSQHLSQVPA
jgi:transposase